MSEAALAAKERREGMTSGEQLVQLLHPLLSDLFAAFDRRGLLWTLLRIPSNPAAPDGDVDLLVAEEHAPALVEVAEELGFVAMPGWEAAPDLILVCYDRPTERWLVLEVSTEISFRSPRGFRLKGAAERVLDRRDLQGVVALPAEADQFWLLLLHCLLDKGSLPERHRWRLRHLWSSADSSPLASELQVAMDSGPSPADSIELARLGQWELLEASAIPLRTKLRDHTRLRDRARAVAQRFRRTARKPLLLRRRQGINVALLGPNGVGKSTAAARVQAGFPFGGRVIYMGLWKSADSCSGAVSTASEVLLRPLRIWSLYLRARAHQLRGRLVIFDRYVYEALLPPSPPLMRLKHAYFWLLMHLVPSADAVVVLDASGQVAFGRKQENPPAQLEFERRVYGQLPDRIRSAQIVDADADPAAVCAEISSIVWRILSARWRGGAKEDARRAVAMGAPPVRYPVEIRMDRRRRGRLMAARALCVEIVDRHRHELPPTIRPAIEEAKVTSTGTVVVMLATPGDPPCAVIKLPLTSAGAAGLERESAALAALRQDERLGNWRALLPDPQMQGSIRDHAYRIDSLLCGESPPIQRLDDHATGTAVTAAADAIGVLHERTSTRTFGDAELIERWIDVHVRELVARSSRDGCTDRLQRLREKLRERVAGRTFSAAWVHGDFWLGNLLFAGSATDLGELRGIVDWDAAANLELPGHDVFHLLLYTRRLRTGHELGQIVARQLVECRWSYEERLVLERQGNRHINASLSDSDALLLYWLRHAALHSRQQGEAPGYGYRLWERRNVAPVLRLI